MNGTLMTIVIVLALAVAAWSLWKTLRDQPPDRIAFAGLAVLMVALLALAVVIVVALTNGERPAEAGTFAGYLITLICLPPLAAVLARMEPTRWGSIIVTVVCLVIPVVVVRLQQTWEVTGG